MPPPDAQPPADPDLAYLWDMLTYAREVAERMQGVSLETFEADRDLRFSIERRIEIIGEAARKVSRAFEALHPEIPWQRIVAQRHVLAHEYGEILVERIYRVAVRHIPDLVQQLEPLVPKTDTSDPD